MRKDGERTTRSHKSVQCREQPKKKWRNMGKDREKIKYVRRLWKQWECNSIHSNRRDSMDERGYGKLDALQFANLSHQQIVHLIEKSRWFLIICIHGCRKCRNQCW